MPSQKGPGDEFDRLSEERRSGFFAEFLGFLRQDKKWWAIPLLLTFLVLGLFAVLASTGAAPFIYTLF